MLSRFQMLRGAAVAAFALCASAAFAQASIVSGPASDPGCMVPWKSDTKFLKFPKKAGPYRIALVNGYIANTWRIQMIKTAKAYTSQPAVAAKLKEFKVVSTGEDVPAQISAVNNFIDAGYDAIIVDAQNPAAFGPAIRRAKKAGVVLIAFDNALDTEDAININVDQYGLGVLWAKWLNEHLPNGGKVLEVRGVAGTSVDTDRHNGFTKTLNDSGKKWNVVQVYGKWDDGVAQKATADALAVQGHFDGISAQGGDTGVVRAMIDAKHPFVPFGGETENGFRKFCAQYGNEGLKCTSAGSGPAQVAVAIKTALAALDGQTVPQAIKLPLDITDASALKAGVNYYPKESDNFFVGNSFPTCGINFSAQEIMKQNQGNQ
ncbi:MAG TPA: sugar ABC transporter substrate-binding protein [Paraburkholderia sp.]|jgi:ribose transport system substrate-binding protein|nr:sugar ABC transporter substrate-binding protein [Paraburkholderia sp.]